jgi:sortase A
MTAAATEDRKPRRRGRRALRTISTVLIVLGTLVLADAIITLVWQEPLSAIYAAHRQHVLSHDLDNLERRPIGALERRELARLRDERRRLELAARVFGRHVKMGQAIGRIHIPSIGVAQVMVQGTEESDLANGPGHYPATPFPGEHGTVGVAGHRTTYGAPFRHLDSVHRGDIVTLAMPYGTFTYRVERIRIVLSDALWITRPEGHDELVLSACHPLYSATHRIVAFARLESVLPHLH